MSGTDDLSHTVANIEQILKSAPESHRDSAATIHTLAQDILRRAERTELAEHAIILLKRAIEVTPEASQVCGKGKRLGMCAAQSIRKHRIN